MPGRQNDRGPARIRSRKAGLWPAHRRGGRRGAGPGLAARARTSAVGRDDRLGGVPAGPVAPDREERLPRPRHRRRGAVRGPARGAGGAHRRPAGPRGRRRRLAGPLRRCRQPAARLRQLRRAARRLFGGHGGAARQRPPGERGGAGDRPHRDRAGRGGRRAGRRPGAHAAGRRGGDSPAASARQRPHPPADRHRCGSPAAAPRPSRSASFPTSRGWTTRSTPTASARSRRGARRPIAARR